MPVYLVLWRTSKPPAPHAEIFRSLGQAEAAVSRHRGLMLELRGGMRNAFKIVMTVAIIAQAQMQKEPKRWPYVWDHPT